MHTYSRNVYMHARANTQENYAQHTPTHAHGTCKCMRTGCERASTLTGFSSHHFYPSISIARQAFIFSIWLQTNIHLYTYIYMYLDWSCGNKYFVLYCIVLCCVVLRCVALRCVALRCGAVRCGAVQCSVMRCVVLCCVVLYCVVLYCIALYCIALPCIDCIVLYRGHLHVIVMQCS